jgi:hypothetical protein
MNADGFVWLFLNWEGFAPPQTPPVGSGYSRGHGQQSSAVVGRLGPADTRSFIERGPPG